jgi:hypothetical protein
MPTSTASDPSPLGKLFELYFDTKSACDVAGHDVVPSRRTW